MECPALRGERRKVLISQRKKNSEFFRGMEAKTAGSIAMMTTWEAMAMAHGMSCLLIFMEFMECVTYTFSSWLRELHESRLAAEVDRSSEPGIR